jgi:uncharacterized protein YbbK (DUF523 family)
MPTLPAFDPSCFLHPHSATARVPVAISACLTGAAVRYDGDHKYQPAVGDWLQPQLELLPVCPEVGANLGVPRPPVQLVRRDNGEVSARGRDDTRLDATAALAGFARDSSTALRGRGICGYLWKSRSPSCGLGSTPLFDPAGAEIGRSSGLQAAWVQRELPWLAMAEETDVQSADGAWRFLLGCRLVFDALRAGAPTPQALAQHQRPLRSELPPERQAQLERAAMMGEVERYVVLLLAACAGLPGGVLRRHFAAR